MGALVPMGKFTAVGMSTKIPDGWIVVDTCALNDTSGAARRAIYVPAYRLQVERWLAASATLRDRVARLRADPRPVAAQDYDEGRGLDRLGPMSHAWVLCMWLNTGVWPGDEPESQPTQRDLFGSML